MAGIKGTLGSIAYWIFDHQLRRVSERESLRSAFKLLGMDHVYFLFVENKHRPAEDNEYTNTLLLSTTERDFLADSAYDVSFDGESLWRWQSLHYLDPDHKNLISYRSLFCIHGQQMFAPKSCAATPLNDIGVDALSGELFHPGDVERAANERAKWEVSEAERKRQEEETKASLERIRQESTLKSTGKPFGTPSGSGWNSTSETAYNRFNKTSPLSGPVPIKIPRMLDAKEIVDYQTHRTPRELTWWGDYVKTILTDDEAVGVCGTLQSDPFALGIWERAVTNGLSKITDTELIVAHKRGMEAVSEIGLSFTLSTRRILPRRF